MKDYIRLLICKMLLRVNDNHGLSMKILYISIAETEAVVPLIWKDNEKGVPQEKLGRIFERFYRCDEARQEKGSGVGLYVVQ